MADLIDDISVVLFLLFIIAAAVSFLYGFGIIEMNDDFDLDVDLFGDDDPYDNIGATPTPDGGFDTDAVAQGVRKAINIVRSDNGLAELPHNDSAAEAAATHSAEMASSGYVTEPASPGDVADSVDSCTTAAVNVGSTYYHQNVVTDDDLTQSPDEAAVAITETWLDRDDELANILDSGWDTLGVGVATGESFGDKSVFVTVLFCSPKSTISI